MENIEEIKNNVLEIKERNHRVEMDKAWETSWTRRISIMVLTFIFASLWLVVIKENHVLLKAIIPVLGYLLSTLSIPQVKKVWIRF